MKIRKGDDVIVVKGKDKGKRGEVLRVLPDADKVIVQGINLAKRHQKPTQAMQQGGILDKPMPIHVSNVSLIADGRATRVGYRVEPDGSKTRISRRTGGEIG